MLAVVCAGTAATQPCAVSMGELWSAGPAALLPEEPRRGRSRRAGRRTRSVSQTPEGYRGAEESGFLRRIVSLSTYTAAILVAGAKL